MPHTRRFKALSNLSSSQWVVYVCGDIRTPDRNVSYSDLGEHKPFVDIMRREFPRGTLHSAYQWCGGAWKLISVASGKFRPVYFAKIDYEYQRERHTLHMRRG